MTISRAMPDRGPPDPEATLRATFQRNMLAVLGERGYLHTPGDGTPAAWIGKPKYDQLATFTGLPRRQLEHLFSSDRKATMVGSAVMARAFGLSLDALMGEELPDVFVAPNRSGSSTIRCVHGSKHLPDLMVCQVCLNQWNHYQQRLNALYEEQRRRHMVTFEQNAASVQRALLLRACPNCQAGINTTHRPGCPHVGVWKGPDDGR